MRKLDSLMPVGHCPMCEQYAVVWDSTPERAVCQECGFIKPTVPRTILDDVHDSIEFLQSKYGQRC